MNQRIIFPLTTQTSNAYERLGGIAAIGETYRFLIYRTHIPKDKLLDLESEGTLETNRNLYRLLRYLKNVLPTVEIPVRIYKESSRSSKSS